MTDSKDDTGKNPEEATALPSDRFRALPERVPLQDTVEDVDAGSAAAPEPGLPQPDRDWFQAGG
jgi:hypothetical protein